MMRRALASGLTRLGTVLNGPAPLLGGLGMWRWENGGELPPASAAAAPVRSETTPGSFAEALGAAGLSEVDVARAAGVSREFLALQARIRGGQWEGQGAGGGP